MNIRNPRAAWAGAALSLLGILAIVTGFGVALAAGDASTVFWALAGLCWTLSYVALQRAQAAPRPDPKERSDR